MKFKIKKKQKKIFGFDIELLMKNHNILLYKMN